MDQERISSQEAAAGSTNDPDGIQDRMVESSTGRHDHGGREHGHDWDDWLKADRALKSKGKNRRAYSKP